MNESKASQNRNRPRRRFFGALIGLLIADARGTHTCNDAHPHTCSRRY